MPQFRFLLSLGKLLNYVVKGEYESLLSYQPAVDLDVITAICLVIPSKTEQIIDEFSDRFEALGT